MPGSTITALMQAKTTGESFPRPPAHAWDYSALARNYDARPGYHAELVHGVLQSIGIGACKRVVDVGAGTGAMTELLCRTGASVIACEPNLAMRALGRRRPSCSIAWWISGCGEQLPLAAGSVDLVSFGSSFNVLPAEVSLTETLRVLGAKGHWLALWNHRDLSDPLQIEVERCIRLHLPRFEPGRRRQDPRQEVRMVGGFAEPSAAAQRFLVNVASADWLRAWRAHATLKQQAGDGIERILLDIAEVVGGQPQLQVPYFTRIYWARRR